MSVTEHLLPRHADTDTDAYLPLEDSSLPPSLSPSLSSSHSPSASFPVEDNQSLPDSNQKADPSELSSMYFFPLFRRPVARLDPDVPIEKVKSRSAPVSLLIIDYTISRCLANLALSFNRSFQDDSFTSTGKAMFSYITLFFPVYFQWLSTQHFTNRFDAEDLVFTIHSLLNLILMSYVGLHIGSCAFIWEDNTGEPCEEYTGSLAALRFLQIIYNFYVMQFNARYKGFIWRRIILHGIVCIMWFIISFLRGTPMKVLWWMVICIELIDILRPLIPFLRSSRCSVPPLHLDLLATRHNRFQTLSLATIMTNVIQVSKDQVMSLRTGISVALSCVILVLFKVQYFDLVDVKTPSKSDAYGSKHPLINGQKFKIAWETLHLPLNVATILFASTLKSFVDGSGLQRYWFSWAFAISFICIGLMQFIFHAGVATKRKRIFKKRTRMIIKFCFIALLFLIPRIFGNYGSDNEYVVTCVICIVVTVAVDMYGRFPITNLPGRAFGCAREKKDF